jgi:hypothetical protein
MQVVYQRCCGLDIHKKLIVACLLLMNSQGVQKEIRTFIPTRILRDTSKMGEVGHRTETFRIGFQLIESFTYLVNDLIERGKSQVRQVFFAHFFPHMFDRKSGQRNRLTHNVENVVLIHVVVLRRSTYLPQFFHERNVDDEGTTSTSSRHRSDILAGP